MNVIDLKGRAAIVTGAARGIGLAAARKLLHSGAAAPCGTSMRRRWNKPPRR